MMPFLNLTLFPKSIKSLILSIHKPIIISVKHQTQRLSYFLLLYLLGYHYSDLTAIDFFNRAIRLTMVYNFVSIHTKVRLIVLFNLIILYAQCTSISSVYFAARNAEREVYDLYGIFFTNHLDLRRILTDYGFRGNPLRKDYPLSGYSQLHYSVIKKSLISLPLLALQEFRNFTYPIPWTAKFMRF